MRGVLVAGALLLGQTAAVETLPPAIAMARPTNPELAAARGPAGCDRRTLEQAHAEGQVTAELGGNAGCDRLGYGIEPLAK